MDFLPSPLIACSLLAALALPGFLLLLSHGPWKVRAPGRRFILACLADLGGWLLSWALVADWDGPDLAASGLILATAYLVGFTLWTLIAWGFTLSMLRALDSGSQDGPDLALSEAEWIREYTGGQDLQTFSRDRLGVLFGSRLAAARGERIVPTPKGRLVARMSRLVRTLLAVKT